MRISSVNTYAPKTYKLKNFGNKKFTESKYDFQTYVDSQGYKHSITKYKGVVVREEKLKDDYNHGYYYCSVNDYYDDGKIKSEKKEEYENYIRSKSYTEYDREGNIVKLNSDVDASDAYEAFSYPW